MTPATRLVWLFLQRSAGVHTSGAAAIAEAVGVSVPTVKRALRALQTDGVLSRRRRGEVGGGRRPDVLVAQGVGAMSDPRQARFFTHSRQTVARPPIPSSWAAVMEGWVRPWQAKTGQRMERSDIRRTIGQWRTLVERVPDAAERAEMVRVYLDMPDAFIRQRAYPLGLLLVRWLDVHREARAVLERRRAQRSRLAIATLDDDMATDQRLDAPEGAVERFRRRAEARRGGAA